jgi:serine/threonine protein kinase
VGAPGLYTIVGSLPRGSDNQTVLALREDGPERKGVVLRPWVPGAAQIQPPALPGLVPVLGFDEIQGGQYALYEFNPGVTLREILEAFKATQRRAPLGMAARIVIDAARVVSALHTGARPVIHGSIHDGALLVGFDGTTRLIDVASCRRSRFESPEQQKGEPATPRSDVYSLAALMHAAATGFGSMYAQVGVRGPASSDLPPPSKHHADATAELDACLFRALTTNTSARAASARLFADELERALGDKLFTREQVGATLSELYGDRVAALKSAIVRAAQETEPPKPRPSRPRSPVSESPTAPRPSRPSRPSAPAAPAVKMIPGTNIPADTQAGQGGGIVVEEQKVLVQADPDPMPTRPQRPRPSTPGAPAVGRRMSRPDNLTVAKPGPPVPSERELAPVPLDEDAPPTGVEQAHKPRVDATAEEAAHQPDDGGASISIGNDPDADGMALGEDDPNPTAIRPRAPPRARPSAPRAQQQTDEEKSMAAGQEKIDTADLDPENQGELAALRDEDPGATGDPSGFDEEGGGAEHESTNVKKRPRPPPGREPLEDDELDQTATKKKAKKKGGRGGLLFFMFLLIVGGLGYGAWVKRPWRGQQLPPLPEWVPPRLIELAIEDGALPPPGTAAPQLEVVPMTAEQAAEAEQLLDGGTEAVAPSGAQAEAPATEAAPVAAPAPAPVADPAAAGDAGVVAAPAPAADAAANAPAPAPPPEDPTKKKR